MIFLSLIIIIVAIALPSINKNLSSTMMTRISAIIFIYSGALAFNALHIQSIGSGISLYSGLFTVTTLSQTLDSFLLILAGLILFAWPLITQSYKDGVLNFNLAPGEQNFVADSSNSSKKTNLIGLYTPRTEYCIIILFSALGSTLLISSSDLLSLYLSLELQSFGLYILATLYTDYESATSSGLKYFLLGALSSCLILLGAALVYAYTGLTNFDSLYSLMSVSHTPSGQSIISGVSLGIIFMFIGLLFKISAAPFHSWSPDVYDETPTQVTMWLSIIPKIAILALLLELVNGLSINTIINLSFYENIFTQYNITMTVFDTTYSISYVLKMLLLIVSLFSLIIGTVVGLAQTRVKRLLAYSTISHVGFILLALAINTEQSIESFVFYILQYSLTNLTVFLIIIAFGYYINNNGIKVHNARNVYLFDFDIRYIYEFKGQLLSNPLLALALSICLFSMSGVPPMLGFFAKQQVLLASVAEGYYFISIIAILVSVISASYYLKIVILLFTTEDSKVSNNFINQDNSVSILSNLHSFLISTLTLFILLFIFKPTLLLNITQVISLSLFNY